MGRGDPPGAARAARLRGHAAAAPEELLRVRRLAALPPRLQERAERGEGAGPA